MNVTGKAHRTRGAIITGCSHVIIALFAGMAAFGFATTMVLG